MAHSSCLNRSLKPNKLLLRRIDGWDPGGPRGGHRGSSLLEKPYIPYQCMESYLLSTGIVPFEPFFHAFPGGLEKVVINRTSLVPPS
ncbi:hypothetical protein PVAP13_2KG284122 [Panicum virgatum]|uniref:Uncharacterized protein ycf68 n=1 Tax=Panicum virgatum TaxID=38727 RepID=A0A8T0W4H3_PANVG|nr:hypothetical protein PVAP13_2KG284122 [Panicum virgatum]